MAEVLGKTNLFSLSARNQNSTSLTPKNCSSCCVRASFSSLKVKFLGVKPSSVSSEFFGKKIVLGDAAIVPRRGSSQSLLKPQMSLRIGKAQKWWEKGLQPNMKEVTSAQDLVDSLMNSGDKLVVVDFFSPGCGGCRALHPKICQLAEMNPDVQFLQVNYEEHKSMCYSLNVHVLPFFRFYRGAEGRLCSFSCTNATIKKFKDALAKHTPDRCSLGPTRGLEEKELVALAANKDLSFTYTPKPVQSHPVPDPAVEEIVAEAVPSHSNEKHFDPIPSNTQDSMEEKLVAFGR